MLSNYSSPNALRYILIFANSIIFVIGMFVFLHGLVQLIGVEGAPTPYAHPSEMTTTTTTVAPITEKPRGRDRSRHVIQHNTKRPEPVDHSHHVHHRKNLTVEATQVSKSFQ
jgi:hypothetical protein